MPNTKTEVWNLALAEIGIDPITDIETDTSKEAKVGNRIYAQTLDTLLTIPEVSWTFAEKEEALALVAGASSVRYTYVYEYPADCVMLMKLFTDGGDELNDNEYTIRINEAKTAQEILTELESAYALYKSNMTSVQVFPAPFCQALIYLLASKAAMVLLKNKEFKRELYEQHVIALRAAVAHNANEVNILRERTNRFTQSRRR